MVQLLLIARRSNIHHGSRRSSRNKEGTEHGCEVLLCFRILIVLDVFTLVKVIRFLAKKKKSPLFFGSNKRMNVQILDVMLDMSGNGKGDRRKKGDGVRETAEPVCGSCS